MFERRIEISQTHRGSLPKWSVVWEWGEEVISLLGVCSALSTEECDKWQGLIGCPAPSDKCCDSEGNLAEQSAGLQECFGFCLLVIKSAETC